MPAKTMLSIEEIREKLSPLLGDSGLRLVVLFGSVATGAVHRRSDIDLAFHFEKAVDILELTNKVTRLLRSDAVDVVDLRRANPLLKYSVVRRGRLLYERAPGLFNEFYSLAFRMYTDTKKLRDARNTEILRYLEAKGLR